ncbi:MAG TPA: DUF262 domain-containing HNH endonuclease family protein [Rhodanobacteraceae bacterium]|nr:DUF262 domain-containing HNH endonuclease family protein [Rhodanobacteraceae bacterium]
MNSAPKIESNDLSIEQMYKDFYVVPDYQREYVWTESDVQLFAEDIYDEFYGPSGELLSDREYFIGSIVVCRNSQGAFDLIDGQQRMTTIYLFLCAIRDVLARLGGKDLRTLGNMIFDYHMVDGDEMTDYRLQLQYEDSHDILERIAERGDTDATLSTPTKSMTAITDAYATLEQFLSEQFAGDPDGLRKFFGAFTQRVKLIRIQTPNLAHALKVFETVNDRGVGLTAMDLLKNLLFMRTSPQAYPKLKDLWKELNGHLEACNEKPLRFLRYFVMASYPDFRTKTHKPVREDELYEWLSDHASVIGLSANPLDFARTLVAAADAYRDFAQKHAPNGGPIGYLDNIQRLSGKARQHFILMLAARHLPTDALNELARHVECLFFVFIATRTQTKNFEWMFGDWSADLRQAKTLTDIQTFVAKYIRPQIASRARDFEYAMMELTANRIQKYRMKYILAKFAQHVDQLAWQDARNTRDLANYLDPKLEIEHILPQKPDAALRQAFDKPDEYDEWVPKLGNLTLLEKGLNAAGSNSTFATKCGAYKQSTLVLTRAIATDQGFGKNDSLTRALRSLSGHDSTEGTTQADDFTVWNSEAISHRQTTLAKLAKQIWMVDLPEQKAVSASEPDTANNDAVL